MHMSVCFTCLCNSTHRKLRCVGNFNSYVPIVVPAEVMPAFVLAKLKLKWELKTKNTWLHIVMMMMMMMMAVTNFDSVFKLRSSDYYIRSSINIICAGDVVRLRGYCDYFSTMYYVCGCVGYVSMIKRKPLIEMTLKLGAVVHSEPRRCYLTHKKV